MSNIEKHKAFLDSLEGEKGLPEEMHGIRFDVDNGSELELLISFEKQKNAVEYLLERLRRAESRQIPDLKEKVKAFGRDAMASERIAAVCGGAWAWTERETKEFRALCAEVKP